MSRPVGGSPGFLLSPAGRESSVPAPLSGATENLNLGSPGRPCSLGSSVPRLAPARRPPSRLPPPQLPPLLIPVQSSRSVVSDSAAPWTAAHQASLAITSSLFSASLGPAGFSPPFSDYFSPHSDVAEGQDVCPPPP